LKKGKGGIDLRTEKELVQGGALFVLEQEIDVTRRDQGKKVSGVERVTDRRGGRNAGSVRRLKTSV